MKKRFQRRGIFPALLLPLLICAPSARAKTGTAWLAAAGKADITPDLSKQTIWIAGYGPMGRKPIGVHDPLYARALLISDGHKTVALVSVDSIGLFHRDVLAMRSAAGWNDASHYLFISATHAHSTPDSLGLWGPFPGVSGVNPEYRKRVIAAVAGLVRNLSEKLEPAALFAAETDVNPQGLCTDSRDPTIIDPELDALQLRRRRDPSKIIATLVRWSCHPTTLGYTNHEISADYPGALCALIEKKTGGACVFENGVIGGHLNPESKTSGEPPSGLKGLKRTLWESRFYFKRSPASPLELAAVNHIGSAIAQDALTALSHAREIPRAAVSFSSETLLIPVQNSRYLLMLPSLVFGHRILDKNGDPLPKWMVYWLPLKHLLFFPLPADQEPRIETEVSLIRLGPVKILGVPGELFPELDIGGYDGRYRFGHPLIKPNNPNPPDLALAPKGPYLRQELDARVGIVVGLAGDELGYIVPNYDFKISNTRLMMPRPLGDHYEETNSIGPAVTRILLDAYKALLSSPSPGKSPQHASVQSEPAAERTKTAE